MSIEQTPTTPAPPAQSGLPKPRHPLTRAAWNPYAVGAGIGLLSWLVFVLVDKPIGMSTAVSAASGACVLPIAGYDGVTANPYWAKHPPALGYSMLFLIGTFIGALISVLLSRSFRLETVPAVWKEHFGPSTTKRLFVAFIGGAIALYGARLAGGCTSGHGISGSLQLALSSWTFFITMFITGVITALILFRRRTPAAIPSAQTSVSSQS